MFSTITNLAFDKMMPQGKRIFKSRIATKTFIASNITESYCFKWWYHMFGEFLLNYLRSSDFV